MKTKLDTLLYYLKALADLHKDLHWKYKHLYGDHLLFDRLYEETVEDIDPVAEKAISLGGDGAIDLVEGAATVHKLLETFGEQSLETALKAEKALLELIKELMGQDTTDGMENLLQGIADKHETHTYLLQRRLEQTKEGGMLVKLFKLANDLDSKGYYKLANEVDEAIKELSRRVGLSGEEMVAMADYCDERGNTEMADKFDAMISESAKKKTRYKTWKGEGEKPPKGAEHKAPKGWYDKMTKEIQSKNPEYSVKRVSKIVGNIWDNELSDAKRNSIYKEYGKKGKAQ